MKVYTQSFFNDYPERIDLFNKSIHSFIENDYSVIIYWMNDDKYKIIHKNITYIDSKEVLNASICRNKLLDLFYNTGEEKAIFCDDDVWIKERIDYNFDFDILSLTNDYSCNLKETHLISSSFMIIKRINKRFYFDETLYANQDLDYGLNMVNNGYKSYRLKDDNIVINRGKSVMFNNPMQKICKKRDSLEKIKIKWKLK